VVLATSPLYYALGRVVAVDMAFTFFLSAGMLAFLLGTLRPAGPARRKLLWTFYVAAALATMTKGFLGILLPGLVIVVWLALLGEWKILKQVHLLSGVALVVLITAPWHLLVAARNPEFTRFYFIEGQLGRYAEADEAAVEWWVYVPVLLIGMFPWIAFAVQACREALEFPWKRRGDHRVELFLFLWALLTFLFFSSAASKLFTYMLPVLPPLALLIARGFSRLWETDSSRGILYGAAASAVAMLLFVWLDLGGVQYALERYTNWPSLEMPSDDATVPATASPTRLDLARLRPYLYGQAAVLFLGAVATGILARRRNVRGVFIALALTGGLFLTVVDAGFPLLDDRRSVKHLALAVRQRLNSGDEVASYRAYYQDLPVYLERIVTVVEWRGELDFGARAEDTGRWMIDEPEFRRRWSSGRRVYAFTDRENYEKLKKEAGMSVYLIVGNDYNVVVTNHPPAEREAAQTLDLASR
ncbi:MAG TPA: phospholipid carrier-dependent glycosyltransferase, partial [Candidatus Binatia bacterium]